MWSSICVFIFKWLTQIVPFLIESCMTWLYNLNNKNKISLQSLDLSEFCHPASTKLLHLLIKIIPNVEKIQGRVRQEAQIQLMGYSWRQALYRIALPLSFFSSFSSEIVFFSLSLTCISCLQQNAWSCLGIQSVILRCFIGELSLLMSRDV